MWVLTLQWYCSHPPTRWKDLDLLKQIYRKAFDLSIWDCWYSMIFDLQNGNFKWFKLIKDLRILALFKPLSLLKCFFYPIWHLSLHLFSNEYICIYSLIPSWSVTTLRGQFIFLLSHRSQCKLPLQALITHIIDIFFMSIT